MNTEKQAQQLELAAAILRTGHPWKSDPQAPDTDIYSALRDGFEIRIVLAEPPYPAKIHNPGDLTAEQVGVGYRLLLVEETLPSGYQFLFQGEWYNGDHVGSKVTEFNPTASCRVPLSVPWPEAPKPDPYAELKAAHAAGKTIQIFTTKWEDWPSTMMPEFGASPECYRIKPEPPLFQLPPPPPGIQWHRKDGWKEGDLPPGYRPYVQDETLVKGDPLIYDGGAQDKVDGLDGCKPEDHRGCRFFTTRPLNFTHEGKQWTYHRPGDPMPCDGSKEIVCLTSRALKQTSAYSASTFGWGVADEDRNFWGVIIGWRYADETTQLGPEDCPPGSSFRAPGWKPHIHITPSLVALDGVTWIRKLMNTASASVEYLSFKMLKDAGWLINRPKHRDANGNPTKWEPCSKTATTEQP